MSNLESIPFTRPVLPPVEDVVNDVRDIWARGVVTNAGPIQAAFERELSARLGWPETVLVSSGSMALRLLCSAVGLHDEVVVSSFTHAATIQALITLGLTPVHADIDPLSLTADPDSVRSKLTERTTGILITHTFGYPADVDALEIVARDHGVALLFDAAAATGVRYRGRSLATFGQGSAFSFHATKLLCAIEAGAVTSPLPQVTAAVRRLRNFGISDTGSADPWGTNGKANELTSAIGLRALNLIVEETNARGLLLDLYRSELDEDWVTFLGPRPSTVPNHSYCCVRLRTRDGHALADRVDSALHSEGIESRRYFARSYATASPINDVPEADRAREDVLCLPLWGAMPEAAVRRISDVVQRAVAERV